MLAPRALHAERLPGGWGSTVALGRNAAERSALDERSSQCDRGRSCQRAPGREGEDLNFSAQVC